MLLRRIEESALNAWPALQQVLYDGWVLRFSQGYTKRANSVNPLYTSALDLGEKIAHCEAQYGERGLPPIFRLMSFVALPGLDRALEKRGYRVIDPTLVQYLDLSSSPLPPGAPDRLREEPLDEWLETFCRLTSLAPEKQQTHGAMVASIPGQRFMASLTDEHGQVVACGLAVQDRDYVGLFDIYTDPARRGKGHATALIAGLLDKARNCGARHAYLQVMENNAPARRVYEARFGYKTVYHYWYRVP